MHNVNAVISMTLKFLVMHSAKEIDSNFCAATSFSGSEEYMPSTLVPFKITSAFISMARKEPAVSVV
jgi:hypothetical protein